MENTQKRKFPYLSEINICIIGLGYVGLPLAIEFAKIKKCIKTKKQLNRKIIGFDLNKKRVEELRLGIDSTNEINEKDKKELESVQIYNDKNIIFDLIKGIIPRSLNPLRI